MPTALPERLPTFALDGAFKPFFAATKALPLTLAGRPVLRAPAKAVPQADIRSEALQGLIAQMIHTMRKERGVGLAAPQIGVGLQVAVLEDSPQLTSEGSRADAQARGRVHLPLCVIINPEVRRIKGAGQVTFDEGCLSVPHYLAEVRRDEQVEVQGLDGYGAPFVWRPQGWPARIVQHECDHLRGVLYVDRMASKTLHYLG